MKFTSGTVQKLVKKIFQEGKKRHIKWENSTIIIIMVPIAL